MRNYMRWISHHSSPNPTLVASDSDGIRWDKSISHGKPRKTHTRVPNKGGCRGYFRDPWFALNFLREMWLLLFYPREPWFVYYRDPWFHKYFPRDLWKRPHFPRENDEKCRKFSVLLNDLQRRISYATIQYFRYKYWCTLHTHRSYIIGVEWGDT